MFNNKKEEIYKCLQEISGIKFSHREVDIIACVLCNRGEKKIASLLSISHRTVGSHIRNIMAKLGKHSREYIIDFVEKAGLSKTLREYYYFLLIDSIFKKSLKKIGEVVDRYTCLIKNGDKVLSKQLGKDLKLANIILSENAQDPDFEIYFVDNEFLKTSENIKNVLYILLDKNVEKSKNSIDFSENYYYSVFELLKKILNSSDLEQIIQEFKNEYSNISVQEINIPHERVVARKYIFIIGFILSVCFLVYSLWQVKPPVVISLLDDFISSGFSADNITKGNREKNYNIIDKVEEVLDESSRKEVKIYFSSKGVLSTELVNYLYCLHALSNYYTHNNYDGEKARAILKSAKNLVESYINSKSKVQLDFNQLDKEEVYVELSIINDLPEIYTRIIHLLGRTYIYQGNKEEGIKYFELAKYLGNKLYLFEGHLSQRNGLGIIQRDRIDIDIKNGEYLQAKKKINESIKLYKKLKDDNTEYKLGYKPGKKPKTIIPKQSAHNNVVCSERIVQHYIRLILITDNINEKTQYIKEITNQFLGSKESGGILTKLNAVIERKAASIYNSLGNILLELYSAKLNFQELKNGVIKQLSLRPGNDLEIIEQVFNIAKQNSRNTDFTKADAYDGLAKVYEQKMKKNSDQSLLKQIKEFRDKKDTINKKLNRF